MSLQRHELTMNTFKIKQAMDAMRADKAARVLAKPLVNTVTNEEKIMVLGQNEAEFLFEAITRPGGEFPQLTEVDISSNTTLKIVYGHYRPDYYNNASHSLIGRTALAQSKHTLTTIEYFEDQRCVFDIKVVDIEFIDEPIEGRCSHCDDKHLTNYVAFAALVEVSNELALKTVPTDSRVAFLKKEELISDFFERDGMWVMDLEETTVPDDEVINKKNWKKFAQLEKSRLLASYI